MALVPIEKMSISEQVFNQMKQEIVDQKWLPGQKLPSETTLAEHFGGCRVTVRQALQKLAVIGLVETRFGEGTFVNNVDLGRQMKAVLLPSAHLQPHSIEEVLEYRSVIEVETAGLAASRATSADIAHLREFLDRQMDEKTRTARSFSDDDMKFHMVIAESTGNPLIIATYEVMWDILNSAMYQTVSGFGFSGALPYHLQLIEAIEARDQHRAIITMKAHMDNNRELFLAHADIFDKNNQKR